RPRPVKIEVHKLVVLDYLIVTEDIHLEMTRDRILTPVVGLARFEHEGIELGDIEILTLEDLLRQQRLEDMTKRHTSDDVAVVLLLSEVGGLGVGDCVMA